MSASKILFPVWSSDQEIVISEQGRHLFSFQDKVPFELRFYQFWHHHKITPNAHDYLELSYLYEGTGTLYVENKKFIVNEDDIFIMGTDRFHRLEARPNKPLKVICLWFLPDFWYSMDPYISDFGYLNAFYVQGEELTYRLPSDQFNHEEVLSLISKIFYELKEKKKFYTLAIKNHLLEILLLVSRYFESNPPIYVHHTRKLRELHRLKNVLSFLTENYQDKVKLSDIAEKAHMSSSYFCKIFKRITGCTLTEYIMRMRLDKAKEFLLKDDMTITEIAREVGFDSHSYFDRVFHRFVGISPREFQENVQSSST